MKSIKCSVPPFIHCLNLKNQHVKGFISLLDEIVEHACNFSMCADMSSQTRLMSLSWCPRTWSSVWCSLTTMRASLERACPTPPIPLIHPARRARPFTPSLPRTGKTAAAKHVKPVKNRSKLAFISLFNPASECVCLFTAVVLAHFVQKGCCVCACVCYLAFHVVFEFASLLCACGPCLDHTHTTLWPFDHCLITRTTSAYRCCICTNTINLWTEN